MQVQPYSLLEMPNANLYADCAFLSGLLKAHWPEEEKAETEPFHAALTTFKHELDKVDHRFGPSIKLADQQTDNVWIALNHLIKCNLLHYDPEVQAATKQVSEIFKSFEMPIRKPYKQAYGIYDRMLTSFRELPPSILQTAGIVGWLKALEQRIDNFRAAQQAYLTHKNESEPAATLKARESLIAAYAQLIARLNARLILMPSNPLEQIAGEWNQYIDQQRIITKASKTRKKNAANKQDKDESANKDHAPNTDDLVE